MNHFTIQITSWCQAQFVQILHWQDMYICIQATDYERNVLELIFVYGISIATRLKVTTESKVYLFIPGVDDVVGVIYETKA